MKRYIAYITLAFVAVVCMAATASAQKMPERSLVRKGNRQFARERYDLSADSYKRALESAPGNFEATYNLGNAMSAPSSTTRLSSCLRRPRPTRCAAPRTVPRHTITWAMRSSRSRNSRRHWQATAGRWS